MKDLNLGVTKLPPCRVPTDLDGMIHKASKIVTPMGERYYEILFPSTDDDENSNTLHNALFILETAFPKYTNLESIVLSRADNKTGEDFGDVRTIVLYMLQNDKGKMRKRVLSCACIRVHKGAGAKALEILSFASDSDFRGVGNGKYMIQSIETVARVHGCLSLVLSASSSDGVPSAPFWFERGFALCRHPPFNFPPLPEDEGKQVLGEVDEDEEEKPAVESTSEEDEGEGEEALDEGSSGDEEEAEAEEHRSNSEASATAASSTTNDFMAAPVADAATTAIDSAFDKDPENPFTSWLTHVPAHYPLTGRVLVAPPRKFRGIGSNFHDRIVGDSNSSNSSSSDSSSDSRSNSNSNSNNVGSVRSAMGRRQSQLVSVEELQAKLFREDASGGTGSGGSGGGGGNSSSGNSDSARAHGDLPWEECWCMPCEWRAAQRLASEAWRRRATKHARKALPLLHRQEAREREREETRHRRARRRLAKKERARLRLLRQISDEGEGDGDGGGGGGQGGREQWDDSGSEEDDDEEEEEQGDSRAVSNQEGEGEGTDPSSSSLSSSSIAARARSLEWEERLLLKRFLNHNGEDVEDVSSTWAAARMQGAQHAREARSALFARVSSRFSKEYDPNTGHEFYVDELTGKSRWEPPPGLGDKLDSRSLFSPAEEFYIRKLQAAFRRHKAMVELSVKMGEVWDREWDSRERKYYYVNKRTNQRQWFKPKGLGGLEVLTPRTKAKQQAREQRRREHERVAAIRRKRRVQRVLRRSRRGARVLEAERQAKLSVQRAHRDAEEAWFWACLLAGVGPAESELHLVAKAPDGRVLNADGCEARMRMAMEMLCARPQLARTTRRRAFPLHCLCRSKNLELAAFHATLHANLEAARVVEQGTGFFPLHALCENPRVHVLMLSDVMEAAPDTVLMKELHGGRTCTHMMCQNTGINWQLVNYLLEALPSSAATPCEVCCNLPAHEMVRRSRDHGCLVVKEKKQNCMQTSSPLHLLCSNPSITRQLFQRVLSANPPAMRTAVRAGTIVHLMCANPVLADWETGGTLLREIIAMHPDNLKVQEATGRTPLHILCANPHVDSDLLEMVLEPFPDAVGMCRGGTTPLQCLCANPGFTLDGLDLIVDADLEAARRETTGPAILALLCGNAKLTISALDRILALVPEQASKHEDGSYPLHRLCANPAANASMLQRVLSLFPAAAGSCELKTGMYPLHYLAGNPKASPEMMQLIITAHPHASRMAVVPSMGSASADRVVVMPWALRGHTAETGEWDVDGGFQQRLPLHFLLDNPLVASDAAPYVLGPLLRMFPQAILERDGRGRTPFDYYVRWCDLADRGAEHPHPRVAAEVSQHNFFYRELQFDMLTHVKRRMEKRAAELVGRRRTSVLLLDEKTVNDKIRKFKDNNSGYDMSGI